MYPIYLLALLVACEPSRDGAKAACSATASDLVDGIDHNCDGVDGTDADGDGFASVASGGDDCDDADPLVNGSAAEVCDALDNDCDGLVDEDDTTFTGGDTYVDADGDGYYDPVPSGCVGQAAAYFAGPDCDDADPEVYPGASEVCDDWDRDEDCDGLAGDQDPDQVCPFPDEAILKADADVVLWGEGAGDLAGHIVRPAGDVDGDGYQDLLIGAYNWQVAGERVSWCGYRGATYLVFGPVDGAHNLDEIVTDAPADDAIHGVAFRGVNCDSTGEFMFGLGDMNGDGYDDIAIDVAQADLRVSDIDVSSAGAVYIIYGRARASFEREYELGVSGGFPTPETLSGLVDGSDVLYGDYAGEIFGATQQIGGDFDGDGARDLVLSAYVGGDSDEGEVYLLSNATEIMGPVRSSDIAWLTGAQGGSRFGAGIVSVEGPDFDGDGVDDLVIASGLEDASGLAAAGVVRLFAGEASLPSYTLDDAEHSWSGTAEGLHVEAVCTPGDLDGDGLGDLLLGPAGASSSEDSAWSVSVIRGCTDCTDPEPAFSITPTTPGDRPTPAQHCGGDLDGDGQVDLILSATGDDTRGTNAGATYVLWHDAYGDAFESGGSFGVAELEPSVIANEHSGALLSVNIGDVTADGLDDLAVGAQYASQDPEPTYGVTEGAVFIFRGASR